MFYLERNLCKKCSENETEVQFCAHQLKSVRDWFLGWGKGTLKITSKQRLGFGVMRVSFLIFTVKNKKQVSLLCEMTPAFGKTHCLRTL